MRAGPRQSLPGISATSLGNQYFLKQNSLPDSEAYYFPDFWFYSSFLLHFDLLVLPKK
jgi:hypothetical protein